MYRNLIAYGEVSLHIWITRGYFFGLVEYCSGISCNGNHCVFLIAQKLDPPFNYNGNGRRESNEMAVQNRNTSILKRNMKVHGIQ